MSITDPQLDRFVGPNDPDYRAAQIRGFALIAQIEEQVRRADHYAGGYTGYTGYTDPVTHDLVITGECDAEYDEATTKAHNLGWIAATSNAYLILKAQGRTDETAQIVYNAHYNIFHSDPEPPCPGE
ncbi:MULTISPECIES: hypothetical protein [Sphingobium]|jgi:hypothetical protein|uniref:hypothetical protein n=1 Tax=Sphingobium TaxID=165695 RepID=UPI0010CA706D|nr:MULTISPECIES: hypothetical protein [Sphingobium]TKV43504.1 hypothetical protein A0U87_13645 [Sphingobium sp. MP9-4]